MAALKSKRLKNELRDLDDETVICRTRRHKMDEIPFTGRRGSKWQTTASTTIHAQRCERCTTVREEVWNNYTAEIVAVRYIYPKGYGLDGAIKPINVRKEYLDRRRNAKPGTFGKL